MADVPGSLCATDPRRARDGRCLRGGSARAPNRPCGQALRMQLTPAQMRRRRHGGGPAAAGTAVRLPASSNVHDIHRATVSTLYTLETAGPLSGRFQHCSQSGEPGWCRAGNFATPVW